MFKKYRATKANVILLESAMKAMGYAVEKTRAEVDYKGFKSSNWYMMFSNEVNAKMQELEQVAQN